MTEARWHGAVIAASEDPIVIENNHYFPPGSVDQSLLEGSGTHTRCPWKGEASYKTIVPGGSTAQGEQAFRGWASTRVGIASFRRLVTKSTGLADPLPIRCSGTVSEWAR